MKSLNKALVEFVGSRIEGIGRSKYVKMQKKYSDLSGKGKEELDDFTNSLKCEAAYLKGLVDGVRISKMV